MSFASIKSKFHIALDGQGLILQGAPDRLAYQSGQAPVYGTRFASGDRSYNDLSQWWYFVQTSWSAGIKDIVSWLDDAKYYYATNIDALSENGAIKLHNSLSLHATLTENIYCGVEANVAGTSNVYIGTDDDAGGKPVVYKFTTGWNNITDAQMTTNQSQINQILSRSGILWILTGGAGNTNVVLSWTGSAFTDQSGSILTKLGWSNLRQSRAGFIFDNALYLFVDDADTNWALIKTTVANPTVPADFTVVLEKTNTTDKPVDAVEFGGKFYYLTSGGNRAELRVYNPSGSTDTHITHFTGETISSSAYGDRALMVYGNKLIITTTSEIWTYDGASLERIYRRDTAKANLGAEVVGNLLRGGVVANNKVYWGNLVYDGTYFHNWIKESTDASDKIFYPLFVANDGTMFGYDDVNRKKVYTVNTSGYKGTADKNFIVFNNFDTISGIDKLAYSATIIFKPLVSGQSITIEYLTGELSGGSWTELGTASYSADGGTVTDKTFYFGAAVIAKKMWVRIKMASGGSNTPNMHDFIMEYLPVPTYKKTWALNVNCGDDVKRLDGALVETTGRELKSRLERSWWTKSILDFQDIDYATTLLDGALTSPGGVPETTITVDSTADFPEQGRLHINDEEITYTGKTPTTFTGCTRGARSTRAATHTDNTVVNNAYKVILTDLNSRVPINLEGNELEYIVGLSLREI